MTAAAVILTALCAGVCLVWTTRHLKISREQRGGLVLTPQSPGPPGDAPLLSVVIAAKDEEQFIEPCVRTMLAQDYPCFEVIVCNDRSKDATPAIVQRVAADDSRLRLVNIEHLPEGWTGKNNAMQQGVSLARGRWICMIDADCRQVTNRTLSVAVQHALDAKADLLSVLPRQEMVGFWENVVQPVGTGVMMIWFSPEKVNDPARPHAYANGAFMLMSRSTYEALGTHAAVRDCLNEDMRLAALAKRSGLKLRVIRSKDLEVVRMYTTLRQMLRGWSRIFLGTFGTLGRLTASLALVTVMGLLPYAALAASVAIAAAGAAPAALWQACAIAAAAAAAVQISLIYRFYSLIGGRKALAWTYPIGCAVIIASLVSAMTKLRKGAKLTWRDTSYGQQITNNANQRAK